MNNKGFSLIELLAVIVVLGLIMSISFPSISNLVSDFRNKDQIEMLKKSAISAAKDYVLDGNINDSINLSSCSNSTNIDISVKLLIDSKYLDEKENEEDIDEEDIYWYNSEHKIRVTYDCVNKKFTEYKYCIKINDNNCIEN